MAPGWACLLTMSIHTAGGVDLFYRTKIKNQPFSESSPLLASTIGWILFAILDAPKRIGRIALPQVRQYWI